MVFEGAAMEECGTLNRRHVALLFRTLLHAKVRSRAEAGQRASRILALRPRQLGLLGSGSIDHADPRKPLRLYLCAIQRMIDEAERAGGYCGPRFDADRGMTRQITAIQAKLFDT